MRQWPPQAIQLPDDQDIAGAAGLKRRRQSQPLGLGTAHGVSENALAARSPQSILLEVQALFTGRHARIANEHTIPAFLDGLPVLCIARNPSLVHLGGTLILSTGFMV